MTVTELIKKHYWGEHDRDKARQFAIDLLEMVKARSGIHSNPGLAALAVSDDLDKALEELRK